VAGTEALGHNAPAEVAVDRTHPGSSDVFVSYSSRDAVRVVEIADKLAAAGVSLWLDRKRIDGGANYGEEIVRAIQGCTVLMLMCSDASLRSRNVKQEIQVAWKYERPYLPVLLDATHFPEQLEYWLEGWQWIDTCAVPEERWLPQILQALATATVSHHETESRPGVAPDAVAPGRGLEGLRAVARMTDQMWPLPTEARSPASRGATRGLGAPQEAAQHGHRLGSRVSLAIETDRDTQLLLLDEGPEGILYCLCPSWFAPDTRLCAGRNYLPQSGARYESFVVSGKPGREHLLAILTDEPLGLDWITCDSKIPARVLSAADVESLLSRLRALDGDRWTALATYFDVLP
jgi:hypothetical protein